MNKRTWLSLCAGLVLAAAISGPGNAVEQTVQKALAPTGKLRVGLQLNAPTQAIKDSTTGELKGVGVELGRELARRLEVPFEPVAYPNIGALLDAGKQGAWDVAFIGYSAARLKDWDYAPLHLQVEFGYLVPDGSTLKKLEDVDRPATRVAVQDKTLPAIFLSGNLKNGQIIKEASNPATLEALKAGKVDAVFSIKPNLYGMIGQATTFRILDGSPGLDPHAMAMPKGRDAGHAYARAFIEEAKSSGLVKAAIDRMSLKGIVVARPAR
jgi:polar amino acid transport system substrate-binding protein